MKKGNKTLTYTQRLILEKCLNAGLTKKEIAEKLGVHLSTVYREIKRGEYKHTVVSYTDWFGDRHYKDEVRYSPEMAEERARLNATAKGAPIKLGNHHEFVEYVERRVLDGKLSPCAVLGEIKRNGLFPELSISKTTLYRYIRDGVFLHISMKDLPMKPRVKRYQKAVAKRPPKGTSIEKRPEAILARDELGHWEMDCVVGRKSTRDVLLVFTERMTRYEIIYKMPNRKAETVVQYLNRLERRFGRRFRTLFKSITVDNGVEFSDFEGLERSIYKGRRTSIYYCHPYTSCERGSNERLNREIRRRLPKGTDFGAYTDEDIQAVEDWVNAYPRQVLGFATSAECFAAELARLA